MRVQLSEKSKAEFIELIAKDSITCWFDGDEFVMPSGQGKTAKGIVLGKLLVWQHRQTEVNELTLQVAEMKSRLNDAYTDGQSAMYAARQSKVDELQRRNQMLNDNIKEQGQKLVYQNGVIETQSEKLLGLRDEKAELQKRVDDLEIQLADWKQKSMPAMLNGMCGSCGKEPLQGIVSDKEDYALLHCFGCGANKYEWIGERALNGGGK